MVPLLNAGVFFNCFDQIFRNGLIDTFLKTILIIIKINLGNIVFNEGEFNYG